VVKKGFFIPDEKLLELNVGFWDKSGNFKYIWPNLV